jgi:hypothetical protein
MHGAACERALRACARLRARARTFAGTSEHSELNPKDDAAKGGHSASPGDPVRPARGVAGTSHVRDGEPNRDIRGRPRDDDDIGRDRVRRGRSSVAYGAHASDSP